jgi:hypothetical protein
VEGISVSVDWTAQGWGLSPASAAFEATCDPNLPDPPGRPHRDRPHAAHDIRHDHRRTASMTITQEQATWFAKTFGQIADNVERTVLGKRTSWSWS